MAKNEKEDVASRMRRNKAPGEEKGERDAEDPPRIVDGCNAHAKTDAPPAYIEFRKCKVHRTKIEGINFTCSECGSVFCIACITNVLIPEGKCMVCEIPVEIDDEFRSIIGRVTHQADTSTLTPSGKVTMIAPEIWHKFEELGLEDDVVDEIIDRLKYVPPEDRLKYLDAYFNDEEEHDDNPL